MSNYLHCASLNTKQFITRRRLFICCILACFPFIVCMLFLYRIYICLQFGSVFQMLGVYSSICTVIYSVMYCLSYSTMHIILCTACIFMYFSQLTDHITILSNIALSSKVIMQGKLIAVAYTLRTY